MWSYCHEPQRTRTGRSQSDCRSEYRAAAGRGLPAGDAGPGLHCPGDRGHAGCGRRAGRAGTALRSASAPVRSRSTVKRWIGWVAAAGLLLAWGRWPGRCSWPGPATSGRMAPSGSTAGQYVEAMRRQETRRQRGTVELQAARSSPSGSRVAACIRCPCSTPCSKRDWSPGRSRPRPRPKCSRSASRRRRTATSGDGSPWPTARSCISTAIRPSRSPPRGK